jgi:transmembrane sensor
MQGPDRERFRKDLDAWIAQDPTHLALYNRLWAQTADARILERSGTYTPPLASGRDWRRHLVAICCVTLLLTLLTWIGLHYHAQWNGEGSDEMAPTHIAHIDPNLIESMRGEIRRVRLADGSTVTLDTESRLRVAIDSGHRNLWLEKGRVRFAVAHEARPFIVHAGTGSVTARGTLFDVILGPRRDVHIALLEGAIDVSLPGAKAGGPSVVKLHRGQAIAYGDPPLLPRPTKLVQQELLWPDGMVVFENMPLTEIVERANHYAIHPVRLGDPALRNLRASGRFRIDDVQKLAENLADLLDLRIQNASNGDIILLPG